MTTVNLNELFPLGIDGKRRALPKQKEFMDSVLNPKGPKYVGYYGGFGSGKSMVLCITMIMQGVMYGGEYVIARHYHPELNRTTKKLFLDLLPKQLLIEHRVADSEVHVRSATGKPAIFYFLGLDDPGKLDSLTLSGWAIDESSQVPEEAFLKLQGRLRSPIGLRKGIITGNPKGHDWAYRRFVAKTDCTTQEDKKMYHMVVAPTTENKHLPADYVSGMLSSYSKERVQRDIMGSFDSFEGQIYTEFDRSVHVIKPFKIPDEWPRIMGADHGYRNATCFLWGAVDYDGTVYVYKEFYKTEWLIEEICKGRNGEPGIIKINASDKIEGCWLDPATKAVRGQTGASDWDAYLDNLPKTWPMLPAKNDVSNGIDRVKSYLKVSERTNKPQLKIFDTCTNLLTELPQYQWAPQQEASQGKSNPKEAPMKVNDHGCDALRYMLMSRPESPKVASKNKALLDEASVEGQIRRELHKFNNPIPKDAFGDW